jgi:hypothetical protein
MCPNSCFGEVNPHPFDATIVTLLASIRIPNTGMHELEHMEMGGDGGVEPQASIQHFVGPLSGRHSHPSLGCRIAHHIIYYLGAGKRQRRSPLQTSNRYNSRKNSNSVLLHMGKNEREVSMQSFK